MLSLFAHFQGGRWGVKARFAEIIRSRLSDLRVGDACYLEESLSLPEGTLLRLLGGDPDAITGTLVETLAVPLGFDMQVGFGPLANLTPDMELKWARAAQGDCFMAVAGASTMSVDARQMLRLFIMVTALRML